MAGLRGLAALAAALRKGERVFMGGSTAEVVPLTTALGSGDVPALDLTSSLVPGMNPLPAQLPAGMRLTNPFSVTTDAPVRHLALSYGGYCSWLSRQDFDTCIVHVAPPRRGRMASLGTAAEFTPVAMRRARRIIAVVNEAIPDLPDAAHLDLTQADLVIELHSPLRESVSGRPNAQAEAIAGHIAGFVGDGAAVQVGLGKVPNALFARLGDRRGLRIQSGMVSDSIRPLAEGGALDPAWTHMTCVQVGTAEHYRWLRGRAGFAVLGCEVTHDPAVLAKARGLIAVNSAIEVDLFGQANLEVAGGRVVSSVGGAADFARAAMLDPAGLSIIGLPASLPGASRIVARLGGPVSLPRHDVEVVVTEHGTADLRGQDAEGRAERLIAIAAPEHRAALAAAWEGMARKGAIPAAVRPG